MKSFKQFLNEDKEFSIDKFASDCKFYLDLVGHEKKILYHGQKNRGTSPFDILPWVERKGPRDSSDAAHAAFNEFFQSKFGISARNWLFTTAERNTAHLYGGVDAVFPIGPFEWIFTDNEDLSDLTGCIDHQRYIIKKSAPEMPYEDVKQLALENTVKKMGKSTWRFNTDFKSAFNTTCEIMIKCDKFYAIDYQSEEFKQVMEFLR